MIGLARIAAPIACLGLAVLLLSQTRRNRIAGLVYAGVGAGLLLISLHPGGTVHLAAAVVGLVVLGWLLSLLFRREPWLVAFATLAGIPIRVNLLHHQLLAVLYVVAAAAGFNLLRELVEGDERSRELGIATRPLALYLAWIGLSVAWASDLRNGALDVLDVYLPFAILTLAIARLPWQQSRIKLLYGQLVAMALIFAGVGLYQYETRTLFENEKLNVDNTYSALFRVNSIFWDPSVYGRFLVVALIATVVLIVRGRSTRIALAGAAFAVIAWLGLLVSFSQSSFAALLVAVFVLAAIVWRWKSLAALAAAVLVLGAISAAQPRLMHVLRHHTTSGLNNATSGRASLIATGIKIAEAHPEIGVGLDSFAHAYSKRTHRTPRKSASHNTPVTVAAEEGVLGFLLYLWLVVAILRTAFRRIDRTLIGIVSLGAGLALLAIFVHSLAYDDFFEDPTTWGLFGLIALAAPRALLAPKPPPVEEEEPVPV